MLLLVRIANVVLCVHTREVSKQFVVNKPLILKYRMLEYKLKKKLDIKLISYFQLTNNSCCVKEILMLDS